MSEYKINSMYPRINSDLKLLHYDYIELTYIPVYLCLDKVHTSSLHPMGGGGGGGGRVIAHFKYIALLYTAVLY